MTTRLPRPTLAAVVAALATAAALVAWGLTSHRSSDDDLIANLDLEVPNGGLYQYFWNTRGKDRVDTLEALRAKGRSHHAAILAEAIARFETELPQFEAEWKLWDRGPDVNRYAVAAGKSTIPELDAAWVALTPLGS